MTPIAFSRRYRFDPRIVDGGFFSLDALDVPRGSTVGVVLLNLGGPAARADVAPFLYNLFMDPAIIDIPLRGWTRHLLCKLISTMRGKKVAGDYAQIDPVHGGSPINPLTRAQAEALDRELSERFGAPNGIALRSYIAMRYWHPFSEEAAEQMQRDGVTHLVMLPLYPHYSKTTTGASLVYWHALEEAGEIPKWPVTVAFEYARHPRYLAALSARIDEAIATLPQEARHDAHILFSAHGTPTKEMTERCDPYCCLIHSTVDALMKMRGGDHSFHVAFQSKVGPAEWLTPSTPDTLKRLGAEGVRSVVVVPVAFVTDHIETAFELDVEVREEAHHAGIEHYGVSGGLNSHPEFIAALAETAVAQLTVDGRPLLDGALPYARRPHADAGTRTVRCHQCRCIAEAAVWHVEHVERG